MKRNIKQYPNMKKFLIFIAMMTLAVPILAQTPKNVKYKFTEASDLNLIGKILPDTPTLANTKDLQKEKTSR